MKKHFYILHESSVLIFNDDQNKYWYYPGTKQLETNEPKRVSDDLYETWVNFGYTLHRIEDNDDVVQYWFKDHYDKRYKQLAIKLLLWEGIEVD